MKLFMHCLNAIDAHHRANLLRSAGIRAEVRNTLLAGAVGDIPFLEAGPQIWIDDLQDAAFAHDILDQVGSAPTQPPWRCPVCRESIEGQFAQCWSCGGMRPLDE